MTELKSHLKNDYKYGFVTEIESESFKKGLNEEVITQISQVKNEPQWMLDSRLKAFKYWQTLKEPRWPEFDYPEINYQDIIYYSAPKKNVEEKKSLDELDPELLKTFEKLGIPLQEQKRISGVAMDVVFDSVSVGTTHKEILDEAGVIFCSISEAIQKYPELVKKYMGTVVPYKDNFFAALNAAVFTDGSFCYIPKGVTCPMDLSTYFRINAEETGQFERTLLIADEGSFVNYLEGCTAPMRDSNQLHAAVVELVAMERAEIKYSTVQNWYAGDKDGIGGIFNFVTKRGRCLGNDSKISWTQVEAGSAITWKYPSCILQGDRSEGFFYSVALTHDKMKADTGTKMVHVGKNTKSTIIAKGISTDQSQNSYRGQVKMMKSASGARNYTQCDSMLVGDESNANTFPVIDVGNKSAIVEHEASTSRISEDQLFYLQTRGLDLEESISILVNGFCKDVFKQLPLEFSVEAVKLIEMKLENSVG
ncbi:MAG: Fe-S cluster assembly protein SufB [Bdellovibrionaceae bacterium]|jgi:Fe-S cluster assembly protein SufB|nr:Fe-S cluster assembly protein SufB [Pseudobdellovibrionaceae bacterium]